MENGCLVCLLQYILMIVGELPLSLGLRTTGCLQLDSLALDAPRADTKLLSIKPDLKEGDAVYSVFVNRLREGYKVNKIDKKIGRVWITYEESGKQEIKLLLSGKTFWGLSVLDKIDLNL